MALLDGLRGIDELTLAHQRLLIRVDFDVPVDDAGVVLSDRKLRAALPTIQKAIEEGARVVLATHLGPADAPPRSIEPVGAKLAELLGQDVYLPDECMGDAARKVVADLREGQVCLLENFRFLPEEPNNDEALGRKLATLCDAYVNEAFGVSHLSLSSTVALAKLVKARALGYRAKAELEGLGRASSNAYKPFVGVLGGDSLVQNLPVLELMLRRCEAVCVGGAVANTLLAARSVDMKESKHERENLAMARGLLTRARDAKVELVLPVDVLTGASAFSAEGYACSVGSIADGSGAYDIGPRTLDAFRAQVQRAKTVLWHGALGALENTAFSRGSAALLEALAGSSAFGVVTGESLTAFSAPELESSIGFVSSGGAASLACIEGKRLPGIEALRG